MKKHILLFDDDDGIVEAVSFVLEDAGYFVATALTENDLQQKIREHRPDIVLIDMLLAGNDGRRICKKLKQNEATKLIPVIISSAHPRAKEEAFACGADDFLAKPFEPKTLFEMIEKYYPFSLSRNEK